MLELLQTGLFYTPTSFYSTTDSCSGCLKVSHPLRDLQPNTTASHNNISTEPHIYTS